jgi:hypothetical protein
VNEPGSPAPAPAAVPRKAFYGRNFSYFSHRVFVVFTPEEMHQYLHERMAYVEPAGGAPGGAGEQIDMHLARWVLLHRSELNALSLSRLLETWLGPDDELMIPATLRSESDLQYRMDITLQFAVELKLAAMRDSPMLRKRQRLQMALLDAAYYVSRLRLDHDRGGGRSGNVDLDLSASGRQAFERYLVQRMNLEEDRPSIEGLAIEPLSDEEVNWLYGVAADVAHTLSSSASAKDLESRWSREMGSRWQQLGLPALDEGFFNVLLLGEQSPLEEIPMSEFGGGSAAAPHPPVPSFRFRWRHTVAEAPPWARSLQDIVANSHRAVRSIRHVDRTLRHAMLGSDAAARSRSEADFHPLQDLADRYRLLPTTPSWLSVNAALENMALAAKGIGGIDALQREGQMLRRYANALHRLRTVEALADAFGIAAALAGLRAPPGDMRQQPTLQDWELAFEALSEGLRCNEADLPEVAQRLVFLVRELIEQSLILARPKFDASPSADSPDSDQMVVLRRWPSHEWFDRMVADAFGSARRWVEASTERLQIDVAGWHEVRDRLVTLARPGFRRAPVAHGIELICHMLGTGPGRLLPLRLETAGCRSWTRVLLEALTGIGASGSPWPGPLRDSLVAHALERLGMRSLTPSAQHMLLFHIGVEEAGVRPYAESHGLWQGPGQSERIALVITAPLGSMADAWPMPPRDGLVLALASNELPALAALKLPLWAGQLAEPLRVVLEPPSGRGLDERAVEQGLTDALANVPSTRIWLARENQAVRRTPVLVEPLSADDLWTVGAPPAPS